MRKVTIFLILTAAVIGAAWFYLSRERKEEQPTFRLAQVERGPIVSEVSCSGTLNAVITVQVGSQVSGQIKELLADFNSEVRKDQVIAQIDPDNFEARVRQTEAELEVARSNVAIQKAAVERSRAEMENAQAAFLAAKAHTVRARAAMTDAKRELDRKLALHKRSVISESELDKATATYDQALAQLNATEAEQRAHASLVKTRQAILRMAEEQVMHALAQVKQREAALNQSKIDLEHTVIRSPVNGVVIERNVDIGQTVAASLQAPTLFTIAQDLRKMQVDADLDEADIGRIRVGQKATFTVDAFPAKEFEGLVEQIRKAPHTVQNVVTYTVVISAANPDLRLLPGMTANVKVVVDERTSALKVPNAALRFRPMWKEKGRTSLAESGKIGTSTTGAGSAEERMRFLIEALKLDASQQAELRSVFAGGREKIMAMRRQGATPDEIRSKVERIRMESRNAIMAILTPEQRQKYADITAARSFNAVTAGRVWVLGPDGKPSPVDVSVGISDGTFTEIVKDDLRTGQQVIVGIDQPPRRLSTGLGRFRF